MTAVFLLGVLVGVVGTFALSAVSALILVKVFFE